jgi:hypothetical protein
MLQLRRLQIMKSLVLVSIIASLVIASTQASFAASSDSSVVSYASGGGDSINWTNNSGTIVQQGKVLMDINRQLMSGAISPSEATELKGQLDRINASEAWYKSFNSAVPQDISTANAAKLSQLSAQVLNKKQLAPTNVSALNQDIDQLINRGLAANHISSSQAANYYMRLAELESGMQGDKQNGAQGGQSTSTASLFQLKADLISKGVRAH